MAAIFSCVGLSFTLVGAGLLFFYGLPDKKIGNATVFGVFMIGDSHDTAAVEQIDRYRKRVKRLNRTGFTLIAVGTLLQIWALFLPE